MKLFANQCLYSPSKFDSSTPEGRREAKEQERQAERELFPQRDIESVEDVAGAGGLWGGTCRKGESLFGKSKSSGSHRLYLPLTKSEHPQNMRHSHSHSPTPHMKFRPTTASLRSTNRRRINLFLFNLHPTHS